MCTGIVENTRVSGSGKGPLGWFPLEQASVSYDHPDHAQAERVVIIDLLSETAGPESYNRDTAPKNNQSSTSPFGQTAPASRDALRNTPPPFSREDFLSGTDNGRISRFRAGSGLLSQSKITGYLGLFPNDSRARYGGFPRFEIRA